MAKMELNKENLLRLLQEDTIWISKEIKSGWCRETLQKHMRKHGIIR
jgi:hypothetical protein